MPLRWAESTAGSQRSALRFRATSRLTRILCNVPQPVQARSRSSEPPPKRTTFPSGCTLACARLLQSSVFPPDPHRARRIVFRSRFVPFRPIENHPYHCRLERKCSGRRRSSPPSGSPWPGIWPRPSFSSPYRSCFPGCCRSRWPSLVRVPASGTGLPRPACSPARARPRNARPLRLLPQAPATPGSAPLVPLHWSQVIDYFSLLPWSPARSRPSPLRCPLRLPHSLATAAPAHPVTAPAPASVHTCGKHP